MKAPEFPATEHERQRSLDKLNITDTPPEERFDRLTRIAKNLFEVPISLVSIVDKDRQWFKSRQGLDACETPRDVSFCGHAILGEDVFCVPDALEDPRFYDNPLVTDAPHIRFYAGAPLSVANGQKVGTLCIIDTVPRTLSPKEFQALRDLADCVQQELTQALLIETTAELTARESHLRAVLDTVIDGIFSIDEKGVIKTVNPSTVKLFGYEEDEMVGHNVNMLMPEPYRSKHDAYIHEYLKTGRAKIIGNSRELVGQRKNGSTFPLELSIAEMEQSGQRTFVGVTRDISERKAAERLKVEFVSTVSHELRTPLTSIKGALGLIRSGVIGTLPDKLGAMLDIAYSNSDRLTRLINDILDIEKIAAGRMPFNNTAMRLPPFIHQAIAVNQDYAATLDVQFTFTDELPDISVHADPDRLMQVMSNLMSNAAKFSPKGAAVNIALRMVEGRIRVSVSDQGPGIDKKFQHKIFEKFTQADSSDKRQKGGTGLGLSIAKAIIEQLGGEIGYETEKGVGTTFYFDLPLAPNNISNNRSTALKNNTRHILICEDDPDIAALIQLMLHNDGFVADIARDAKQAKHLLSQTRYSAMTLDLDLPDQNGVSLIRELRDNEKTRELPIIVISATANEGKLELNGDTVGIIDWMQKPIDQTRFFQGLKRAMRDTANHVPQILHIEDDPDVAQVVAALVDDMAEITSVGNLSEARTLLGDKIFDLIILDLMLPDGDGQQLLPFLKKTRNSATPTIIFSVQDTTKETIDAIYASLVKSRTSNETLRAVIRTAIDANARTKANGEGMPNPG
ncbi:PAS domain S-box-containing protein [Varunaivibrio sulfuroxidans]|uniref:Sensor protein FixL n=1 Tax=Varunaivibrio sulfuroxidans TaxID=1773489 RepID=A0A4R3JFM4_9PROT|nr:PAS domain S-box-containing protein [Varunaivibrio sulfuroxidans]